MAAELIYTSAVRGIKPGTSGFCTVAMTRSLLGVLADRLEALSGFRPLPGAAEQPVATSHWIIDVSGTERHVLSAVRAASPDHTHRSNKLAHHVVLKDSELIAAGPAWLLLNGDIVVREWAGEPEWLETERVIPDPGIVEPQPCTTWERWAGDPGWAGVLVNQAILDRSKSVSVVYPAGAPALQLIAEAMAILPASLRWRIPFTSFAMEQQAGLRISWRFCMDGTPPAAAARRAGDTIDLCARAVLKQQGRCIDAARAGKVAIEVEYSPPSAVASPASVPSRTVDTRPFELADEPTAKVSARAAAPVPEWSKSEQPDIAAPGQEAAVPMWRSTWAVAGLAAVAVLAIGVGTALGVFLWQSERVVVSARAALAAAEKSAVSAEETARTQVAAELQRERAQRADAERSVTALAQERDAAREQQRTAEESAAQANDALARARDELAAAQAKLSAASQPPSAQASSQRPWDTQAIVLGTVGPPIFRGGDLVDTPFIFQPGSWVPSSALRLGLPEATYGMDIRVENNELLAGEAGTPIATIGWDGSVLVFNWTMKSLASKAKEELLKTFPIVSGRWEQLAGALVIDADGGEHPGRIGKPAEASLELRGGGSKASLVFGVESLGVAVRGTSRQVTTTSGSCDIPVADAIGMLGSVQVELSRTGTQVTAEWKTAPDADEAKLKDRRANQVMRRNRANSELAKLEKENVDRRKKLNEDLSDAEQRIQELEAVLANLPSRLAAATAALRVECAPPGGLPWLVFVGQEPKP